MSTIYQDNLPNEKTEVIYGSQNIIRINNELWSEITHYLDICADKNVASFYTIPNHPITVAFRQFKERGIKVRVITEITKDNIPDCKEIMKWCELRHMDEIKGNFGIGDGLHYRASAKSNEAAPPPLLICSTVRAFVEQQQYFFDMLWNKAIPAKKRTREIEDGSKREFIETIQDPKEILDLIQKLISESTEELLLIVSNNKILQLFENEIEFTRLLREQLREGNHIQVIIHGDKQNNKNNSLNFKGPSYHLYNLQRGYPDQFEIQYLTSDIYDKLNIFISDREKIATIESSKSIEDKIASKDNILDLMGLATYSNSESTVSSYATIFDTLWIRSILSIDN